MLRKMPERRLDDYCDDPCSEDGPIDTEESERDWLAYRERLRARSVAGLCGVDDPGQWRDGEAAVHNGEPTEETEEECRAEAAE